MIRAIVRKGVERLGHEFVGYRDGWRGPLEGDSRPLGVPEVRGILPRGGTILGSSRTNPFAEDGGPERIAENLAAAGVDGLIAIGGEDTLGAASRLHEELGLNVIGVPKTIDNDLSATDYTFGFDTAVNIAMEAIDRLHTTADSHHRVLIVEVMGRHAGWIAFHAGPRRRRQRDPDPRAALRHRARLRARRSPLRRPLRADRRRRRGRAADRAACRPTRTPKGAMPSATSDSAAIAHWLEGEIERRTGKETRATVLGHVQRGGTPTAFDRVLATRFGLHAIDAADAGRWGTMAALRGTEIELVAAHRGDGGAEDGAGVALRRGRGLLWLVGGGADGSARHEQPEAALECFGGVSPSSSPSPAVAAAQGSAKGRR